MQVFPMFCSPPIELEAMITVSGLLHEGGHSTKELTQQLESFLSEQAQALKAEAPVERDVCLVSNRVWQVSLLSIAALVMD